MREITLVNNRGTTLVDDDDYDNLIKIPWYLNQGKYAYFVSGNKAVFMHRCIMNAPEGSVIDHIDGNGLNNQKSNLRICTQVENGANRAMNKNNKSGYKGVSHLGRNLRKPWRANLRFNGRVKNLGNYETAELAAAAYDKAVKEHLDEHAFTNSPH